MLELVGTYSNSYCWYNCFKFLEKLWEFFNNNITIFNRVLRSWGCYCWESWWIYS